jgi:hypothetical protein
MRLQIYISDEAVLEQLDQQRNKSGYICRLIKQDIKGGPVTRDEVVRLIEQYVKPAAGSVNKRDAALAMFEEVGT